MGKRELIEKAALMFEANPQISELIATSDGLLFFTGRQNAIDRHCRINGKNGHPLRQYIIQRPLNNEVVEDDKTQEKEKTEPVKISKAAQKLIDDNKLDSDKINGTGKEGTIIKKDVNAYLEIIKNR